MGVSPVPPRIAPGRRWLSRVALWFEAIWPAIWPALGVAGVFVAFALFEGPRLLPLSARPAVPALAAAGVAVLLWRGLRRVRRPTGADGDRRLERTSGLRHRPLATLADTPADDSPAARELWQAHQDRVAKSLTRLRVGAPRPGLPAYDRHAVRGAVVIAVVAGLVAAGPDSAARLRAAVVPPPAPGAVVPGAQVEAWATPPAYTGVAPIFLRPDAGDAARREVRAPAGSHLVVSVTGGTGTPAVSLGGTGLHADALDAHSFRAETDIARSGALVVTQDGLPIAAWMVAAIPDAPPTADWTAPPGQDERVTGTQVRLPWHVADDYGVVSLRAELRLVIRPEAAPVPLALGVPSGTASRDASGGAVQDLVANPWAGLEVAARLVATDAAGQTGHSADATFTLPERTFNHPVARQLIAARKALSVQPDGRTDAAGLVDRLAEAPDAYDNSAGVTVEMGAIASLLRGREKLEDAQARMWQLALQLEENAAERTAQALEKAREAAREAMAEAKEKPADSPERQVLDQKLQQLREAIDRHMRAMQEQARREGTDLPYDHTAPKMNQRDMDRMAEGTRDKAQQNKMADAEKQLQDLEKLLDQLQSRRPEHGEEKAEERRQRGRQQMSAVQDMVQREGGLMDRAQDRAQDGGQQRPGDAAPTDRPRADRGSPGARPQAPGAASPPDATQPRTTDARQQRALRRALGELMQRFGDLTGEIPPALGDADMAMRDADDGLQSGSDSAAAGAQLRAIQALQKGARQMGQQLARQLGPPQSGNGQDGDEGEGMEADNGQGDGQDGQGDGLGGADRDGRNRDGRGGTRANPRGGYRAQRQAQLDPLGRETENDGVNGRMDAGRTRVPEEMERVRTRELQEELRRREAEKTRPPGELDYIDRLLKPY